MKKLLFLFFLLSTVLLTGQESGDRDAVLRVIKTLFDGMRAGDSAAMRPLFHPDVRMQTTFIDEEGQARMTDGSLERWLSGVARPKADGEVWDEKIWRYDIQVDQNLATAWTEYTFYRGDQLSHCGANAFQLFRGESGWQIFQVTDTRRRENCRTPDDNPATELADVIDDWHIAAAMAEADIFFGSMSPDAVYIGTDASERWLRDDMREWAREYFEGESAWAFKPFDRHIAIAEDGRTAWWDEKLDTWMGICRGSGILAKTPEGWKIKHYHLSVTVPNERIQAFIELTKE